MREYSSGTKARPMPLAARSCVVSKLRSVMATRGRVIPARRSTSSVIWRIRWDVCSIKKGSFAARRMSRTGYGYPSRVSARAVSG